MKGLRIGSMTRRHRATWSVAAAVVAITGCGGERPATPAVELRLPDLAGAEVAPLRDVEAAATVFLFVRTDCPIANRYVPDVKALEQEYTPRGVHFWLVYPDPAETADKIRAHLREYGYAIDALRDPHHDLVERVGATITPEAAVFGPGGELLYRGRIDDRYVDFGRTKPRADEHDLARALDDVLAGRPVSTPRTQAVGCYISAL